MAHWALIVTHRNIEFKNTKFLITWRPVHRAHLRPQGAQTPTLPGKWAKTRSFIQAEGGCNWLLVLGEFFSVEIQARAGDSPGDCRQH
jgi:hypothetical protein